MTERDIISVKLPEISGYFEFRFPLRYGDQPLRMPKLADGRSATFVVRQPKSEPLGESWTRIFSSLEIEVLENKSRAIRPLRWGLSSEEKRLALRIVREALGKFLKSGAGMEREYFYRLPHNFSFKTDLDVALWTMGHLRGSAVLENKLLGEGLAEAARLASSDARFKPLVYEELPNTRIEITVFSDLRIPLSGDELKGSAIYPEKGYLLEYNKRKGWYLPEVFNARRFRNLEGFLSDLAEEKAGLARSDYQQADISIFEVDDFIESENQESVLSLFGPVAKENFQFSNSNFQNGLKAAADWLTHIQEADGNIPPITDPLTGRAVRQIDWPRLAFTAWALAEFGKAVSEEKYFKAAEKSFEYLQRNLFVICASGSTNCELTLAYFGELALSLGKLRAARDAAEKLAERLPRLNWEPLVLVQIASFYKIISAKDSRFLSPFQKLAAALKENFERIAGQNGVLNLAVWAELVNTFADFEQRFSEEAAGWLKNLQLASGAFPESTISAFSYSRGTGKIFEVLALNYEKNKTALEQALTWLLSMQYDEENIFFVPEEIRHLIIGSFRHDFLNPEAWIDAAGHILLGGTRMMHKS